MKLACLRCKQKKLKCDRTDPICNRCVASNSECLSVERRKRPRLAQQKVAVQQLNNRLETLEKRLNAGIDGSPSSVSPSIENIASTETTPAPIPSGAVMTENGQDSWIYRMATDARQNFENANPQAQTPTTAPTPLMGNAMSALNDALNDLGKPKARPGSGGLVQRLKLSTAEHKESIEVFIDLFKCMVIPDVVVTYLDLDLLRALPDIVNSPYINLDPGLHVMYYIAVYYGLTQIHSPGDTRAEAAYRTALDYVPAWLETDTERDFDGFTAACTAWAAVNNLDYQLSWKLHCKSSRYIKTHKIDRLDLAPATTREEDDKRDASRTLYWHILGADLTFRLFFGKPGVVQYIPNTVKPPSMFTIPTRRKAAATILSVVWIQCTAMTADILNIIDNCPPTEHDAGLHEKVDKFCLELEDLLADWDLESLVGADRTPRDLQYIVVDIIMNTEAFIVGVKRLVRSKNRENPVDATTLRAARRIMNFLVQYGGPRFNNDMPRTGFVQSSFMSFYPFCAVFSLYEHVLASTDPDDCEDDLQSLEQIGAAMTHISSLRTDFVILAKTITALNKVSRTIQDERKKQITQRSSGATPNANESFVLAGTETQPPKNIDLPSSTYDALHDLVTPTMPFSASEFPAFPEMVGDGNFQPVDFVRALESDFLGGHWQEDWWSVNGDQAMD